MGTAFGKGGEEGNEKQEKEVRGKEEGKFESFLGMWKICVMTTEKKNHLILVQRAKEKALGDKSGDVIWDSI